MTIYKFSVGQKVKLKAAFKPAQHVTLPAETPGKVVKVVTRKTGFQHECPYDVKWDGFAHVCPMRESEIRAG